MVVLLSRGQSHKLLVACSRSRATFNSTRCSFHTSQKLSSSDLGFKYHIAASYSAKGSRFNPNSNLFVYDPSIPFRRGKRPESGQDAFFVSRLGTTGSVAFGVADGVGGYVESGIDPAQFSHGLCEHLAETCHELTDESQISQLRTRDLMEVGLRRVRQDESIFGGGSTACLCIARSNGSLQVANLGDSGFIQFRLNAVHHRSTPQTHGFNFPYQLSLTSPKLLAQQRLFGGRSISDSPKDADVTDHDIRHGDVLVFASDGVWDNLSSSDALRLVSQWMTVFGAWKNGERGIVVGDQLDELTQCGGIDKQAEETLQSLLAVGIADTAKAASINDRLDGPFAREVKKHFPRERYRGGKMDDICVVVAIAVQDRNQT